MPRDRITHEIRVKKKKITQKHIFCRVFLRAIHLIMQEEDAGHLEFANVVSLMHLPLRQQLKKGVKKEPPVDSLVHILNLTEYFSFRGCLISL